MSTTTVLVVLVIAIIVILILRVRSETRASSISNGAAETTPSKPDVRQVAQLLLEGKKVEAINAYMEVSGVGLEEAKNAVERYSPLLNKFGMRPSPPSFETTEDWSAIDELLENGDKIGAIKLYREITGCDLKEAKDAIDIRDDPS